jgi:hypothetical protein
MPAGLSGAVAPESRASLPVCYGKDDEVEVVYSKDDVEGKSTKDRPAEAGIENLESIGRDGDEVNQTIQLIQKPNRGPSAPLGVPSSSFFGVL